MNFRNLHCVTELYTEHDSSTSQNWIMSILDCFTKMTTMSSNRLEWWRVHPLLKMPHILDEATKSHRDGTTYLWTLKSAPRSSLCYQPHHWHWRLLVRWEDWARECSLVIDSLTTMKKESLLLIHTQGHWIQGDFIFIHVQSIANYL